VLLLIMQRAGKALSAPPPMHPVELRKAKHSTAALSMHAPNRGAFNRNGGVQRGKWAALAEAQIYPALKRLSCC
jgi:hypothetical protein